MVSLMRLKLSRWEIVMIAVLAFGILYQGLVAVHASPIFMARVEGKSMIPALYDGDLVVIMRVGGGSIHAAPKYASTPGDIIVYYSRSDGYLIIHRAIAKAYLDGKWRFLTQGDNVAVPDAGQDPKDPSTWITEDRVVGKVVVRVPKVGLLTLPVVRAFILIALVIAVLVYLSERKKSSSSLFKGRIKATFKRLLWVG
ncbi:MAG: signal peptidase I [Candidatus Nezhaarchaeales archaeon]